MTISLPSDNNITKTFMPLLQNPPGKSLCINIDWILKFHIFLNSIQWDTESLGLHERAQLVILVLKEE